MEILVTAESGGISSGSSGRETVLDPSRRIFATYFQIDLVVCLSLFAGIIIITFKRTIFQDYSSLGIQKAIKTMVLSIIVLDSVFVSGTAGLYYGLATLLLIIPSIVLARELYVT